jgi:hypothetical protein
MRVKLDVVLEKPTCVNSMRVEKSNAFGGHIIEIPQLGLEKVYT